MVDSIIKKLFERIDMALHIRYPSFTWYMLDLVASGDRRMAGDSNVRARGERVGSVALAGTTLFAVIT